MFCLQGFNRLQMDPELYGPRRLENRPGELRAARFLPMLIRCHCSRHFFKLQIPTLIPQTVPFIIAGKSDVWRHLCSYGILTSSWKIAIVAEQHHSILRGIENFTAPQWQLAFSIYNVSLVIFTATRKISLK